SLTCAAADAANVSRVGRVLRDDAVMRITPRRDGRPPSAGSRHDTREPCLVESGSSLRVRCRRTIRARTPPSAGNERPQSARVRRASRRPRRSSCLENRIMPAKLSEVELSDLDFTDTVVMRGEETNEAVDPTERILGQLDLLVDSIALKVELGSNDARLWRILAGVYLAAERIADYSDLVRKHLAQFGTPLRIDQPPVSFALPVKV